MKNIENSSPKNLRYEVRLSGSGGQGIVLAGVILAEAAVIEGRHVAQSQTYGPESRGGNALSEVILSEEDIDYAHTIGLDMLVALTQDGCNRSLADMKPDGLVIVDSDLVHGVLWSRVASIPLQKVAQEVGESRAINIAALGAIAAFCPLVSPESLTKAITNRLPPARVAGNLLAFNKALKLGRNLKKHLAPATVEDSEI